MSIDVANCRKGLTRMRRQGEIDTHQVNEGYESQMELWCELKISRWSQIGRICSCRISVDQNSFVVMKKQGKGLLTTLGNIMKLLAEQDLLIYFGGLQNHSRCYCDLCLEIDN